MKRLCYLLLLLSIACTTKQPQGYQGQGPIAEVSTLTVPVQKQWKGIFILEDSLTYFSNDFEGGRLNGVVADGNDRYTVLITAENEPINPSPWYAFTVWTEQPRTIIIKLTYQDSNSRYYPKISRDGINFSPIDSTRLRPINPGEGGYGIGAAPEQVEFDLEIGEAPIYIAAQELWTSSRVKAWIDTLDQKDFIAQETIGKSREGRPLWLMTLGNADTDKALMIISRQHPPEVTGFLAMKSFIETIAGPSEQAQQFRASFVTYVVPLMNPDGVDNGHWRHNMGGIDLNRDWHDFNQPETQAVRDFLVSKSEAGKDFVFGGDFHSTWDDIYYPIDTSVTAPNEEFIYDWIEGITTRLPQKQTNIRPSDQIKPTRVSRNYFYVNHGMPAIVFELGDNTPRGFLKEKGKVAAEELMQLLMDSDL